MVYSKERIVEFLDRCEQFSEDNQSDTYFHMDMTLEMIKKDLAHASIDFDYSIERLLNGGLSITFTLEGTEHKLTFPKGDSND